MENILIINELKVFAYHGVNPEEKINGQNFFINAEIETEKLPGYNSDALSDTLNYSKIIKEILKFFTNKRYNLIEKIAEDTAEHLLKTFQQIDSITLTVKKPEAPISADIGYVAIKISRKRSDYIG